MAEESGDGQEKTEEPSQERKDEFRDRGEVVHSREISSVLSLVALTIFFTFFAGFLMVNIKKFMVQLFGNAHQIEISNTSILNFSTNIWQNWLNIITPVFMILIAVSCLATFSQTRFNFSMKRLEPKLEKFNVLKGLQRMVSSQAALELVKSILKMLAVGLVATLILYSEFVRVPGLINLKIDGIWSYWADITSQLFWSVSGLLVLIGGIDFIYNYTTLEKKMRMSKQEVKEEFKKREVDPQIKNRIRRMQRDISTRKMLQATRDATAVITNPDHYAVAIRYDFGMEAPIVVAKGVDFLAQRIKEEAKTHDVPLVENKPLARTLFKLVEIGEMIPESLYKAISEIIRYVFKLKGIKVPSKTQS